MKSRPLIRPLLRRLRPYEPGEQPKIKGLIKLNTNENPYPPAPEVLDAIKTAVDGRLRLYPNPTSQPLREKLARHHNCRPENIIVGNGSDELLAMVVRSFVEPQSPESSLQKKVRPRLVIRRDPSMIQYFHPSYSLYPVLADAHGAKKNPVSLRSDFALPSMGELRRTAGWNFHAALTYITTPNAPSGRAYAADALEQLCRAQKGVVVLDEAYVDFADNDALQLALRLPNVLVARTFSKAYSLCSLRVGYLVGPTELISALDRIRDSYNVNHLGQVAAEATLEALPYYRRNFRRVIATRNRLSDALSKLDFHVLPSQANFILVYPPRFAASDWFKALRRHKILVRWFNVFELQQYLRITIGTDAEASTFIRAVRRILQRGKV